LPPVLCFNASLVVSYSLSFCPCANIQCLGPCNSTEAIERASVLRHIFLPLQESSNGTEVVSRFLATLVLSFHRNLSEIDHWRVLVLVRACAHESPTAKTARPLPMPCGARAPSRSLYDPCIVPGFIIKGHTYRLLAPVRRTTPPSAAGRASIAAWSPLTQELGAMPLSVSKPPGRSRTREVVRRPRTQGPSWRGLSRYHAYTASQPKQPSSPKLHSSSPPRGLTAAHLSLASLASCDKQRSPSLHNDLFCPYFSCYFRRTPMVRLYWRTGTTMQVPPGHAFPTSLPRSQGFSSPVETLGHTAHMPCTLRRPSLDPPILDRRHLCAITLPLPRSSLGPPPGCTPRAQWGCRGIETAGTKDAGAPSLPITSSSLTEFGDLRLEKPQSSGRQATRPAKVL
jgi:hypothetical protein